MLSTRPHRIADHAARHASALATFRSLPEARQQAVFDLLYRAVELERARYPVYRALARTPDTLEDRLTFTVFRVLNGMHRAVELERQPEADPLDIAALWRSTARYAE